MTEWPHDAPRQRVLKALERLGLRVVRIGNHISLEGCGTDGSRVTMTLPNHRRIKGSTLRTACRLAGIERESFIDSYRRR